MGPAQVRRPWQPNDALEDMSKFVADGALSTLLYEIRTGLMPKYVRALPLTVIPPRDESPEQNAIFPGKPT
jgi:hypothetical protein